MSVPRLTERQNPDAPVVDSSRCKDCRHPLGLGPRRRFSRGTDADALLIDVSAMEEELQALRAELRHAADMQRALIAPSAVAYPGLRIAGYSYAASYCSGDWWDVHDLGEEKTLIVVGDVTGHGSGPAMIAAMAKGVCDAVVRYQGHHLSPSHLLEQMNHSVLDATQRTMNMTSVACVIDQALGTMEMARAGHPTPYVLRPTQGLNELLQPVVSGVALGSEPAPKFESVIMQLEPGDQILWYSDGVTERSANQSEYGTRRLRRLLRHIGTSDPASTLRAIHLDLAAFSNGSAPSDDITMAIAQVMPWPG